MDGSLPENHRFRLNEDNTLNNDGKFYIFVKLTDSCMKTIETYFKLNKKQNLSIKSNIKFNSNGGDISIPINNNEKRTYSFQIAPEDKTPEVFQCIKQINKDQLESCGLIEQRINIQAQEDVYSMTKTKVTKFQENEDINKKKTKEIGESSKTILQKKTNKSSNSRSSTTLNNSKQQRTTNNQEFHLSPNTNNQLLAFERPLRERLVHLLAAKTYKKPELLVRLKLDGGIRDDEKEQLDSILSSISTQSKSGEFIILKNLLTNGEVNYEWPFYPKAEASNVRKKIKDLQANANRSNINKTTTDNSTRSSLPNLNVKDHQTSSISSSSSSSTITKPNRSTINDEKNQLDNEQIISNLNPLSDEKMQQLSDMLDKLSNAITQTEKTNEQLSNEIELLNEDDYDQAEKEYNRLVPEYNHLIDYLKNISEKFSSLQQQFNEEQNNEKAKKIVEEFLKCENEDGFLIKRQRVVELHFKLTHLQKILEKNSKSNNFDFFEDEDDDDDDDHVDN